MRNETTDGFAAAVRWIRDQEIGRGTRIDTPFGSRLICYADLTATGRHLRAVEAGVRRIRPIYANTHTEISSTGLSMTRLREGARRVIHRSVGASDEDEVVFVGAGATGAINKLVGLLGLSVPDPLDRLYGFSSKIPAAERPIVLLGPYEHHSNELPWLESIAEVVEIGLDENERIDLDELARRLDEYRERTLKIGSFSVASNVTGVLTDIEAISRVLHRGGAYAFFDCAAAGPYVPIDMHPTDPEERIDALFLSPHKFVGGPEASGVLVAHRSLFRTRRPVRPGGGTVDYVAGPHRSDVDYVARLAEREEGGTPAIIGDIRAGMAFLVKERSDPSRIRQHEIELAERASRRLARHPKIRVLGPSKGPRLAIIPIMIDRVHHDFCSALLDHLFGIQNRSGCSCAGPYGHRLLSIGHVQSAKFRHLVAQGIHGIKPGWVRVSLPYYASEQDIEFILSAVEFVATHAETFLPLYRLGWRDGGWRVAEGSDLAQPTLGPKIEDLMGFEGFENTVSVDPPIGEADLHDERARYFEDARAWVDRLDARWKLEPPAWNPSTGDADLDELTWFRFAHADSAHV